MAIDDYSDVFDSAGSQYGVDPQLLRAIAKTESGGDPSAFNKESGASGLMQLIPTTAKSLGVDNPNDPEQAINGAAKLMAENIKRYKSPQTAVMAYHGGTDPANWGDKTHEYVQKVMSNLNDGDSSIAQGDAGRDLIAQTIAEDTQGSNDVPKKDVMNITIPMKASARAEDPARDLIQQSISEADTPDASEALIPERSLGDKALHKASVYSNAALKGAVSVPALAADVVPAGINAIVGAYHDLTVPEGREVLGDTNTPPPIELPSTTLNDLLVDKENNPLAFDKPETPGERVGSDVISALTGSRSTIGMGNASGGAAQRFLSTAPATQYATAAAGAGAGSYAKEAKASPLQQIAISLLAGGAGGGATALLTKGLTGAPIAKDVAEAAQNLKDKYDVFVPGTQLSNNPLVKLADKALPYIPFSGHGNETAQAKSNWTRAVSNEFGEDSPVLTAKVMDRAKTNIGKLYNEVYDSIPDGKIKVTDNLLNKLSDIEESIPEKVIDGDTRLNKIIDRIQNTAAKNGGAIPVDVFRDMIDSSSSLGSIIKNGGGTADIASDIKKALFDALGENTPTNMIDKLNTANKYYKNYNTVRNLAKKEPLSGGVEPANLLAEVDRTAKKFGNNGMNNLRELAQGGAEFFPKGADVGNNYASLARKIEGGAAIAGAGAQGLFGGNPLAIGNWLLPAAGAAVGGKIASSALNSKWYQKALIDNALNPKNPNYLRAIGLGDASGLLNQNNAR